MSYQYKDQKYKLFTDKGQRNFLSVRDESKRLLQEAGAFRECELMKKVSICDSWEFLACVDRLIELKEIVCVRDNCWRQYRVYSTSKVHNY